MPSFTSAAVGCRVIATDIRPDLGPFGDEPKGEVKNKVPGSVLMSFLLDSEPIRGGGEKSSHSFHSQNIYNSNLID